MKKLVSMLLALTLVLIMGCAQAEDSTSETTAVRIGALKGPTSMGMAQMLKDAADGNSNYQFTIAGAPDEITALLVKGELDVAAVPSNLASVLYNNTNGGVKVAMINTLGILYVVEAGDTVNSVADLKGRTVYSSGKGATPEYSVDYILSQNGIDPETDVTVEFKSEHTELAAALQSGTADLAVLPEPFVTTVLAGNDNLRVALNLNEEWDKVSDGSGMVTGVLVVRSEFAEQHPDELTALLEAYEQSVNFVNENPAEAAGIIEQNGIAKAAVAEQAIPKCNIVFISGNEMRTKVEGFLEILFDMNPKAVGGALPGDDFYYGADAVQAEAA
ncbi:MAG: ABC transporter substrate-binding protein [Clostridiales bacterium]|nr:ABC transporter substrate-binding protein [Clostridiales bacterium]